MSSVDFRTRHDGDSVAVRPESLFEGDLARAIATNRDQAGSAAKRLGLPPLTLQVEADTLTFDLSDERLEVRPGTGAPVEIALDGTAFADLINDSASAFGLQMTGRARAARGHVDHFIAWEPVLRCLLDGRPVYQPGSIDFRDRGGAPLDLRRSFTPDDDPDDIGHFLSEAGFLHVSGMFSEEEMAAVSAELDTAIAEARPDDGASWWASTEAAERYPARILGFNQKSPTLRDLLRSNRFGRIGTFTDDTWVQRDPDRGDSAEGLLKKVGVVEGISDVSWHKDCAMGGHSRHCCGMTVGISVTGAQRESGELGVVPGSHRANISPLGVDGLDLPRLPLPTRTGDITIHCSCTLHMSRPPVSAERRVVYTGFALAPRPGDEPAVRTAEDIRRQRASLNDHVRSQQRDRPLGASSASFDLA